MSQRFATAGHVNGYDVLILPDRVIVTNDAAGDGRVRTWRHDVPNYGTGIYDLADRPGVRLGWDRFPDGAEVASGTRTGGCGGDRIAPVGGGRGLARGRDPAAKLRGRGRGHHRRLVRRRAGVAPVQRRRRPVRGNRRRP